MESKTFKYCLLQYMHSQVLREVVNIGIFFQFSDGVLFFKHPDSFERIKGLYEDFSEVQLKENLEAILFKVNRLNESPKQMPLSTKFSDVIRKDATVLQLSETKTSLRDGDYRRTMDQYFDLYFAVYYQTK